MEQVLVRASQEKPLLLQGAGGKLWVSCVVVSKQYESRNRLQLELQTDVPLGCLRMTRLMRCIDCQTLRRTQVVYVVRKRLLSAKVSDSPMAFASTTEAPCC